MPQVGNLTKLGIIAKIVLFDLIAGLFLVWMVIDDPRRTPALVVLIPMLACVNIAIAWWKFRSRASITLPAIYFFGSVGWVVWTAAKFEWWKLPLLLVPLTLLIVNAQRFRRVLASEDKR